MELWLVLLISFLLLIVLGSLLHFTHDWFNRKGILIHWFSALNESTWEHMKLLVAPTLLVAVFQYVFLSNDYENIFNGILVLLFVQTVCIPILYEPLRFLFKEVVFWGTIFIFVLSVVLGILAEYWVLSEGIFMVYEWISFVLIFIIVLLFGIFSYYPPKFFLFRDPVTGRYGDLRKH